MEIKEYIKQVKEEMKNEISSLKIKPVLTIIQVNEDEASKAYIRGKLKDAAEVGITANLLKLPIDISEEDLIKEIEKVNEDNSVHGLIVQMPLPKHINEEKIKLAVSYKKDVDGFHPLSHYKPCTPQGIITYLKSLNESLQGKNALVIGRSNIVGKPMAKLLLNESCNVTVTHSKTSNEDMKFYVKHADIIVIAVGKKEYLDDTYEYNPNAIIVDVGINRVDGKLYGDCMKDLPVRIQTPVPGGVGLLTRITLLKNLMEAYYNGISNN
ncbi:MAG: bifunctional 5,10-methylenetetrahydrofolate dehydrogenase/5,10-methenyltetrahydrofolate cyclohydrolase [Bacilli bacterium]